MIILQAYQFSSSNDKNTRIYIHRRLTSIENQLDMQQFLLLGDYLFQNGEYDEAEILYSKANKRAEVRNDAAKKLSDKMQAAFNDALKKCDDALAAAWGNFPAHNFSAATFKFGMQRRY